MTHPSLPPAISVLFINGWSFNQQMVQPLMDTLLSALPHASLAGVICPVDYDDLDDLKVAIAGSIQQAKAPVLLVGWSLGGALAVQYAHEQPEQIAGLVLLQSSPCFVANETWAAGMPVQTFSQFQHQVDALGAGYLSRFDALACQGARDSRALMLVQRQFRQSQSVTASALSEGLKWLAAIDVRNELSSLALPVLHLLGEKDALVSVNLANYLKQLGEGHQVVTISAMAHMPLGESLLAVGKPLSQWFAENVNKAAMPMSINKQEIAASFGRAAVSYDQVAHLQRKIGERAMSFVKPALCADDAPCIVDLGCGTGYFTGQLCAVSASSMVIGMDLAEGMLHFAHDHRSEERVAWCAGDAENIPLANESVDMIFSSLAIQWCADVNTLFSEIARVLKPGGRFVFATLVDGTLYELKQAWQEADSYQHVNRFLQKETVLTGVSAANLLVEHAEVEAEVPMYETVRDLTQELKQLGAHNLNQGRSKSVTGRERIRRFRQAYETFRNENGLLPATYQVFYGVISKPV